MAKWLAKEFDWTTGRYTGRYYDIAEAGIVAVFVDSFYGDDTAAGTAAAPFKTLSKAITTLNSTGANGSRIFMNGIFSENLPAQTYWYRFIGCGGGKNGRTIFYASGINVVSITKLYTIIENIITINYGNAVFVGLNVYSFLLNCFIQNCDYRVHENSWISKVYNSIFKNVITCNVPQYQRFTFYESVIYNMFIVSGSTSNQFAGRNNYFLIDPASTGTVGHNTMTFINSDLNVGFLNINDGDFNVRITSPLIGSGPVEEISGNPTNIGGVDLGLPYNGLVSEFTDSGGATITDLTIDATGKYTITAPATSGTLETALMDLGNIYPLENIDLFNVFDFASGEITQGVFETFSSPRMALTIKLKYGLTSAEVNDCPWLLIEYGKQPTFSGTGASRMGNAADTFNPDTFQTITCRYMKLFITLQNNS